MDTVSSSTNVAIVETDQGEAYLKALGNPEGPHALAADLVGTRLADAFGLPVLEMAVVELDDLIDIPFANGELAKDGPALVTRAVKGEPWGGDGAQLKKLVNPEDITRLVLFDTWIRNRDRHGPREGEQPRKNFDNVFLSEEVEDSGKLKLLAIDHTHCFAAGNEISPKISAIGNVKDQTVYGLFDEFRPFLDQGVAGTAVELLGTLEEQKVNEIVASIPKEWEVDKKSRDALLQLITQRAKFVSQSIFAKLWPQTEFGFSDEAED